MKYLKVFTDFLEVTEGLGDAGMGRLFRAMLRYAQDGTEPLLRGKEAVAWAVARQSIDREVHTYKAKVASAETARTCLKQKQSDKKALISEQDKDNNKNNDNDKYKGKERVCGASAAVAASHARPCPPSLEEIEAYCRERGNRVNAQRFMDFYTANGWRIGKNPMRDWKAAVRSWESNGLGDRTAQEPSVGDNFKKAMEMLRMEEAKQI